jgi:hypothetical protein
MVWMPCPLWVCILETQSQCGDNEVMGTFREGSVTQGGTNVVLGAWGLPGRSGLDLRSPDCQEQEVPEQSLPCSHTCSLHMAGSLSPFQNPLFV